MNEHEGEQHLLFPGLWGALWLVLAGFMGEYVTGALVTDLLPEAAPMHRSALARLLANALLFAGLMSFKRLSYRELFHGGRSSVPATLAMTLPPVLAMVPALMLAVGWVVDGVERLVPLSAWEEQAFSSMAGLSLAAVVMSCVMAPVLEEMLFRGVVLRSFLRRYAPSVAIVHSAAIFGLAHMNLYQFFVGMILGMFLGWLYERTRSLWPCIALHAVYNAAVTFLPRQDIGTEGMLAVTAAAALGGIVALGWMGRFLGWPGQGRPSR